MLTIDKVIEELEGRYQELSAVAVEAQEDLENPDITSEQAVEIIRSIARYQGMCEAVVSVENWMLLQLYKEQESKNE